MPLSDKWKMVGKAGSWLRSWVQESGDQERSRLRSKFECCQHTGIPSPETRLDPKGVNVIEKRGAPRSAPWGFSKLRRLGDEDESAVEMEKEQSKEKPGECDVMKPKGSVS